MKFVSRTWSSSWNYQRPTLLSNPSFKPTDAALKITKQLLLTNLYQNKNMTYSPLSVHIVLSMIASGTKGHTQDMLLSFLKFKFDELNELVSNVVPLVFADGSSSSRPRLSFTNGVWVEKSCLLKPSYKQVMNTSYKASVKEVDFKTKYEEARREVNIWAEKETNGRIKEIIPKGSVDEFTRLVLANALYFKGAWDKGFKASETRLKNFHLLDGSSIRAPFMSSTKGQYISAFYGFKVLKLPYKQGGDCERRFSMLVYLPNKWTGLQDLVERFSSESGFIDRYTPQEIAPVGRFCIPKFQQKFYFEVADVLKPLGLSFQEADFTEMVHDNLRLVKILHKSFIEVNEEGTEAAAVTVTLLTTRAASTSRPPRRMDFVADHPFMYLIKEEVTGTVMFIGHVLNPIAIA